MARHANPQPSSLDHPNLSTPNSSHLRHATNPTSTNHSINNDPNFSSTQQSYTNPLNQPNDTNLHSAINLLTLNLPSIPSLGENQVVPHTPANSLNSANSNHLHVDTVNPTDNPTMNYVPVTIPSPSIDPTISGAPCLSSKPPS